MLYKLCKLLVSLIYMYLFISLVFSTTVLRVKKNKFFKCNICLIVSFDVVKVQPHISLMSMK